MRILLTAFEPFGKHEVNASAEVARRLAAEGVDGVELLAVELPVVRFEAERRLFDALDAFGPDAVVMLGIAETRGSITPERVAINVDDYRIPDNVGNRPADEPIAEDGPAAYFSSLPVKRIVRALAEANVPVELSNTAGTYLCNRVFYATMHRLAGEGSPVRAGFVHIPQMAEAPGAGPAALPLETLTRGIAAAIRTLADGE